MEVEGGGGRGRGSAISQTSKNRSPVSFAPFFFPSSLRSRANKRLNYICDRREVEGGEGREEEEYVAGRAAAQAKAWRARRAL